MFPDIWCHRWCYFRMRQTIITAVASVTVDWDIENGLRPKLRFPVKLNMLITAYFHHASARNGCRSRYFLSSVRPMPVMHLNECTSSNSSWHSGWGIILVFWAHRCYKIPRATPQRCVKYTGWGADRSVSASMTLSDLEGQDTKGKVFRMISVITCEQERPNSEW